LISLNQQIHAFSFVIVDLSAEYSS